MRINIVKMYYDVIVPTYAHNGDAGCDIYAHLTGEPMASQTLRIKPHTVALIPTGFKMAIPEGYEAQIRSRSGMAKKGLIVANSPGTIDSGYRGEVGVLLLNATENMQFIQHGDRIAQMVIAPVTRADFQLCATLGDTDRGEGGYGSSGT
jgi:dUTP pyrophosphatase